MKLLVVLLIALGAVGCWSEPPAHRLELAGSTWRVDAIAGAPASPEFSITFGTNNDVLVGTSCGEYAGGYMHDTDGSGLEFWDLDSMAECSGSEPFAVALLSVTRWRFLSADRIDLLGQEVIALHRSG